MKTLLFTLMASGLMLASLNTFACSKKSGASCSEKHKKTNMSAEIKKNFKVQKGMDVAILINGMSCGGCASRVEAHFKSRMKDHNKIETVKVSFPARTLWIKFKKGKTIPKQQLLEEVGNAGYHVEDYLEKSTS